MRSRLYPACLAAAVLAVSVAATPSRPQEPAQWSAVVTGYQAAVQAGGITGSALALVRDGRLAAHAEVGLQDAAAQRPVTPDTIFHWASITKTFTGIAIMQLRDRGLLSLDDPVVKYVPELRQVHDRFGDVSDIKIRHLMSHSAGFRAATWPWGGDQAWHPFEPTRWEQLVAMLPYTEVQFAPGSQYSYSNPGVIFLGRIIEQLTGDDYEVYVGKNILMPLDMRATFFDRAPYFLLPRRSHSYFRDDSGVREARFDFDTGITVSNGGLNAPLPDMAKYVAFLLATPADETAHPEYATVLRRASLREMWVPQLRAIAGEGVNGSDSSVALSFFVEHWSGVELVGHSGDQNGFISHLYLHPASATGWILSMNTDTTRSADGSRPSSRDVDMKVRELMLHYLVKE